MVILFLQEDLGKATLSRLTFFFFCTEGLHGLITKAANDGDIRGVSICKNVPKLMHLLFVDDSLVFCRSTEAKCHHLLHILSVYERASGQQVNRAKTNLFFSKSTPHEMQSRMHLEWQWCNSMINI